MIDHFGINCSDLASAAAFYDRVLGVLGHKRLMDFEVAIGYGTEQPQFWITQWQGTEPNREIHDLANMLLGGLEIAGHGFDDVIEVQMVMPITVYPGRSGIAKPRLRNTQDSVRRDLSREAGQIAGAANPKLAGHKRMRTSLLPRLFYDVLRHQW